ncbi:MAG: hypothetical protein CSA26_06145 [Desulfobacterales bacterium]|nr:MAG: hypothetical protein CSA26_06145 [Desulfobacterales bacterium]
MGSVLIVDDNEDLRFSLAAIVRREKLNVEEAATGSEALHLLASRIIDLVFLDIGLPDGDGIRLISDIKGITPDIGIVMLTGINDAKTAVESLKAGALDYIVKPFDIIEFKSVLRQQMQSQLMRKRALLDGQRGAISSIICACEKMRPVKTAITSAAEVDSSVLIVGETGTGKEIVARTIHESGRNTRGLFVKIDCGTLAENLIESELFGYDKGAFTGAGRGKKGLVEVANGGTLFLDEIANLPINLQPKLLRLIEESTFRKVGGLQDIKVRVRIIAATNSDLEKGIRNNTFREDLFYRLNVIPIVLPPLRERDNDILLLADFFLHQLKNEMKKPVKGFTDSAVKALLAYSWPGNIRELRNLVEREIIFSKGNWLSLSELCQHTNHSISPVKQEFVPLREMEKQYINMVLKRTQNNKSEAARLLGISRTTLRAKLS